ncbi:hypothetical protein FPQ18DRAFT_401273 [Pyronema domesticum]|uniref:Similar to Nitronate monooxygenase acc. no. Q01284 n=1 Tax=Pyronema omphalodes (strain CBS 100304) TaxID=1076935 RepID=U4KZ38_PYROM|nr:hypothetical protein FPQ18DRAFT_401273 [Pyronema domesticum]CCX06970.1 Similar to Nitronate monooxygenase; acc. no. Q01284 [Pyronema omphalodes CBS 100304]
MPPHPALAKLHPTAQWPLIVSAPMRTVSGPALTSAVSAAGGLGFYAAGYTPFPSAMLSNSLGINEPYGVGYLLFSTPLSTALSSFSLLSPAPIAVWLFAPSSSSQMQEWISGFRSQYPSLSIWVQVATVDEAVEYVGFGADVVVAQGREAGGHGRDVGGSWVGLVREVKEAVGKEVAVLAAGGISDGETMAAAVTVGADAVVVGTALIVAEESEAEEGFRELVIKTRDGGRGTVRTRIYDTLRGTGSWPEGWDGRAIINDSFTDHEAGMDLGDNLGRYQRAVKEGDYSRLTAYAGAGVGLVKEVKPAGEIVRDMREGARRVLREMAKEFK